MTKDTCKVALLPESPFYDAQERMKTFLLSVNDDQMLYNFRNAAGLDVKGAPPMEGWDAPDGQLRGHTTGHYMSGLALCYRATGDEKIKEKALYMIDSMEECQRAFEKMDGIQPGFLSGYSEEQFDLLEKYTTYPTIWAPYYTLHKLFAGFLECYDVFQSEKALQIAVKLGKWTWNRLSRLPKEQLSKMWSMYIAGEFGGMNAVMAQLYQITGKEEFLKCAKLFDNEKLFAPLEKGEDALNGMHANQHIPQLIGAMEIFKATGERRYYEIASRFWEIVTESRIYATGGTGEGEMFHERYNIAGLLTEKTQESCASYNMLKITKELFQQKPDAKYMDYYERTLLNHILVSLDKKCSGESTYFLPMGPGMKKEFLYENSCCHGTGMESHFKYGEMICSLREESLWVNLYIPAKLNWEERGLEAEIHEDYIWVKGNVSKVKLRKPDWTDSYKIWKDGETLEVFPDEHGYLEVTADFSAGCEIQIEFEKKLQLHRTPDDASITAISYGTYILAAIADITDFLEVPSDEKNLGEKLVRMTGEMAFEWNHIKWVPLYQIDEEAYHVYVKCV